MPRSIKNSYVTSREDGPWPRHKRRACSKQLCIPPAVDGWGRSCCAGSVGTAAGLVIPLGEPSVSRSRPRLWVVRRSVGRPFTGRPAGGLADRLGDLSVGRDHGGRGHG